MTRRVYTSVFCAPQWHGATQTHFPPRPRKSARRCDIADVISPHGLPTHYKQSNHTIPPIIPLSSAAPRLHQHVSRSPVARRHANALCTKAAQIRMALRHRERKVAARSAHTLQKQAYKPPIIPLTSDTPRLHQDVSRSPVARRHANALSTKAAQIRMALRHRERNLATRSMPTYYKQSIIPLTSDTPRLRQHVSRSPVARRHVNALSTKAAQIRMALRHCGRNLATRSAHTLEAIVSHDTASPRAHQRHPAFSVFRAPDWHGATPTHFPSRPRKSAWHCHITDVISPHSLPTHYKQSYRTIPPIIPLTSDTPRLHQHASRSPVARPHANAFCTKAAQIRMALRHQHHECNFAIFRRAVCPDTRSNHNARYCQSSRSPATSRIYASMFRAPQWHGATQTHFPPRPRKSAWRCDITDVISPHGLPTHYKQSYHAIPPVIRLTSDTPRLHQHVSRSPVARRHADALPTKAAQIRMALRHYGRNFAPRSAHTLQAIVSHDTANCRAHQRHAAFTPACLALPSGTAPRKRTLHQGRANPHGAATSRT